MDRQRGRDVALAVLTALALALAAAAAAPMFAAGPGDQPGDDPDPSDDSFSEQSSWVSEIPQNIWAVLVGIVWALWQLVALVILWILSFLDPFNPGSSSENSSLAPRTFENRSEAPAQTTPNGSGGFGEGSGATSTLPIDETTVLALLVAMLLALVFLAVRYDVIGSVVRRATRGSGGDAEPALEEIGRVAGDAADRVAAANSPEAAENAVFRAWREMVGLLDVPDPQSRTPRQFADAAVDAGMEPDDVAALTDTFEEVRYGGASPSANRRHRATDAFRRIAAEYGGDDGGGADPTGDVDAAVDIGSEGSE